MHLVQLPSGNWRALVRYQGRRGSATAPTRGQATFLGAQKYIELGGDRTTIEMSIIELVEGRLAEMVDEGKSPLTIQDWRTVINRAPASIQDRPVGTVSPVVLGSWWRLLKKNGWSRHRVKKLHAVLSSSFASAIEHGIVVTSNPCRDSVPAAPDPPIITVPSHEVARALVAAQGLTGVLVMIAASTGLRRGEIAALQWDDFVADRAELVIWHSLIGPKGGGVVERETKQGQRSHRPLHLALPATARLLAWRREQAVSAMTDGISPKWIMSSNGGRTPLKPHDLGERWARWRESVARTWDTDVQREAGYEGPREGDVVRRTRLHHLRHYVATTMLQDGVALIDVAQQLGDDPNTVSKRYAKFMPGRNVEAIDRLAARLL